MFGLTGEFFHGFLTGVMLLCGAMALVWVLRVGSKGLSAYLMACSFLLLGAFAWALREETPVGVRIALAVGLGLCLTGDVLARAARKPPTGAGR